MSTINNGEPTDERISRLTDNQARAIVTSGMPDESVSQWVPAEDEWRERLRLDNAAYSEWRKTDDYKKNRQLQMRLLIAALAVLIATACGSFTLIVFIGASWRAWSLVVFSGLIIELGLLCSFALLLRNQNIAFRSFRYSYRPDAARQSSTKQAGAGAPGKDQVPVPEKWLSDPDLQNLLLVNRTQLNLYQEIATKDAKAASRNSRFAIGIGFIILVVGAVVAVRTPSSTSKIVVAALASLGSVLSGYIGQTFLRAQADAMKQLNYYFRQPLVASYLLSAERIALKLNDENSTRTALRDVIKNVLQAADRAEYLDSAPSAKNQRKPRTQPTAAKDETQSSA
jgi:hypothetical protein